MFILGSSIVKLKKKGLFVRTHARSRSIIELEQLCAENERKNGFSSSLPFVRFWFSKVKQTKRTGKINFVNNNGQALTSTDTAVAECWQR